MTDAEIKTQLELIRGSKIKLKPVVIDDVSICPVVEINFDRIDSEEIHTKLCTDPELYLKTKNHLIFKTDGKCSAKERKATVTKFLKDPNVGDHFWSEHSRYGFVSRFSYFEGTIMSDMTQDERLEWACANTRFSYVLDHYTSCVSHNDSGYYFRIAKIGEFGYIALNLLTFDIIISNKIGTTHKMRGEDIAFVHSKAYRFLKSHNILDNYVMVYKKNMCRQYYDKTNYLSINDIWYPLPNNAPELKVSVEQMKNAFELLTMSLMEQTDNVYCCSHLEYRSRDNGIGQMYSNYVVPYAGLIVHVDTNEVEFGIKKLTNVSQGLHNDTISRKNNGHCKIQNKELTDLFKLAGVNTIIFRKPVIEGLENIMLERFEKTIIVCVSLNENLLANYDRYKNQTYETDWASVPFGDLYC